MTELEQRQAVIDEAMTWCGTPYMHRARLKGIGVDCAQFPMAVYGKVGVIPDINPSYSTQWHLHRSEELYLAEVERFGREIERREAQAGDFGIWKYGRTYSHGAIFLSQEQIIHSYVGVGVSVDEVNRHSEFMIGGRDAKFYTLWGLTDGR